MRGHGIAAIQMRAVSSRRRYLGMAMQMRIRCVPSHRDGATLVWRCRCRSDACRLIETALPWYGDAVANQMRAVSSRRRYLGLALPMLREISSRGCRASRLVFQRVPPELDSFGCSWLSLWRFPENGVDVRRIRPANRRCVLTPASVSIELDFYGDGILEER